MLYKIYVQYGQSMSRMDVLQVEASNKPEALKKCQESMTVWQLDHATGFKIKAVKL